MILSVRSLRIVAVIKSGPKYFIRIYLSEQFVYSIMSIVMSFIDGNGLRSGDGTSLVSSTVKTDSFCLFKMFALSFGPSCIFPLLKMLLRYCLYARPLRSSRISFVFQGCARSPDFPLQ